MTTETQRPAFGEVVEALMESRGIPFEEGRIAELAEKSGLDPEWFVARVRGETSDVFGRLDGLADTLVLSRDERMIMARAYTFETGGAGDVRAGLFDNMIMHLDFVACMDEEDHGGSSAAEYIRAALIPFCEVEKARAVELLPTGTGEGANLD